MHWQRNMCREHLGTFFQTWLERTTIVKVVVFGSSGSSRDSSAKTNQRSQGVFGCERDKWFTNYSQYRGCDDRWKLRRRLKLLPSRWLKCVGPEYVLGRVPIRFDFDLGCAEYAGRRSTSCNSRGWFMFFFGSPQVSIEELACKDSSWRQREMVPSVYRVMSVFVSKINRLIGQGGNTWTCPGRMQTGMRMWTCL